MRYLFAILIALMMASTAWGWTLTSDPSDQATHWRITLDDGTVHEGAVCNGTLCWDIDQLGPGVYQGEAQFSVTEWEVETNGTVTDTAGETWSDPTPFTLKRRGKSDKIPKLEIE